MFGCSIRWTTYAACYRPQGCFRFVNFGETIERCRCGIVAVQFSVRAWISLWCRASVIVFDVKQEFVYLFFNTCCCWI